MYSKLIAAFVTLGFAATSLAADLGAATFSDTRVRPTQAAVGVGFFTVTPATNDTILSLQSECCKAVELHRTERLNGVMAMRRIKDQALKKGKPLVVQPDSKGGEHLMLIGLKAPLSAGDTVDVTFTFEKAGTQTVSFPVKADAVGGADNMHHSH